MNEPIPNYDQLYCTPPEEKKDVTRKYEVDVLISVTVAAFDDEDAAKIAADILKTDWYTVIEVKNVELL